MNKLIEKLKHGDGQSWHVSRATLDQAIKALEAADAAVNELEMSGDPKSPYAAYRNLTQETPNAG